MMDHQKEVRRLHEAAKRLERATAELTQAEREHVAAARALDEAETFRDWTP